MQSAMKTAQWLVICTAVRAAIIIFCCLKQCFAQDEYVNCSSNYTILEAALLRTSDNLYQLTTTFFNPDLANPLYVNVYYNFSDSKERAHYIWSTSSVYLFVAPPALGYLTLFFSYFDKTRSATVTLHLPQSCLELSNITASDKSNMIFVLSQRLRVYAKYYTNLGNLVLPDGFEARVVSIDRQYEKFIDDVGVKIFFSFVIILPAITSIFVWCYVKGTRVLIRDILSKPSHHSSLASSICLGQMFTIYVTTLDILALSEYGIVGFMRVIIYIIAIVEIILFFVIICLVFVLCCAQCFKREEWLVHLFHCFCWPLFCGLKLSTSEIKSWVITVGLIPPVVCLSSHIGFMIEGWMSFESHGTALMLFYSLCFVFLFVTFKQIYLVATDYSGIFAIKALTVRKKRFELRKGYKNLNYPLRSSVILHHDEMSVQEQEKKKSGLNFCILLCEMIIGIPFTSIVLLYIAFGFTRLPVLRATEQVVTHVYNFGHISVVFVLFLLTYNIFSSSRTEQTSGFISKDAIKFWRFLDAGRKRPAFNLDSNSEEQLQQNLMIEELNIQSDADKANALNAVLLFRMLQLEPGNIDNCERLLTEIMPHGHGDARSDI